MRQLPLAVRLNDAARFENYLPGPNAAVLAEVMALTGPPRPGLFWLCGPKGSGKTHLLQALCARAGDDAVYLPVSQLAPFGSAALAEWQGGTEWGGGTERRGGRWLCLDDVALAVGRADWERALFGLYRDAEERGASLLVAARESPTELPFALADMRSRCAAGHRLVLRALNETEQCAALTLRARQRGFELPTETAQFLMRRLDRDMSSLFAVLDELDAAALAAQRPLTVPFIRSVLAQRAARPKSSAPFQ